jgi:fimbrial isopeptide formation D2 family protein
MDTVNVYPKNSQVIVTKTVNDTSAVKVSDHVTWTILGDVQPDLTLSSYAITDQLDPRLTYANATVDLTGPGAGTLTSPGDYTISESGGLVTVEFTAAGLTKLEAAAHDGETKVQVVIDTVVNAPGEIPNDATMFINDPGMTSGVQVDTIPETDFGQAEFAKMAFGTTTPLPGAEFRVYATKADAASGDNPLFGQTSFTSNSAGLVVVDGLKYGTYWLAESKAPDGYELMVEPVQFTVDQQADGTADFTVYDVKSNAGFTLPSVGGQRWILPTVAAIAAAGLLALMTVRRRRSA